MCPGQEGLKGRRPLATRRRRARRSVRRFESRNPGSIDLAVRRTGRKGAGESCRSGRRPGGRRIRDRAARKSGTTAVAMTAAGDPTVVATGAGATAVATGAVAAGDAEESRQREGSSSRSGRGGRGGFAGE